MFLDPQASRGTTGLKQRLGMCSQCAGNKYYKFVQAPSWRGAAAERCTATLSTLPTCGTGAWWWWWCNSCYSASCTPATPFLASVGGRRQSGRTEPVNYSGEIEIFHLTVIAATECVAMEPRCELWPHAARRPGQRGPGRGRRGEAVRQVGRGGAGVLGFPLASQAVTMVRVAGMFPTTLSLPSRGRHATPAWETIALGEPSVRRRRPPGRYKGGKSGEEVTRTATHDA